MYPPIFAVCAANATVTGLLGLAPVRLYPAGEAPPKPTKPYAVWQMVDGTPENYLGTLPDIDSWSVQLDVYADTLEEARDVAEALRDAIEPVAHVTRFSTEGRDPDTNNYRYSMDSDWWLDRPVNSS
jgi:hypothetical protein